MVSLPALRRHRRGTFAFRRPAPFVLLLSDGDSKLLGRRSRLGRPPDRCVAPLCTAPVVTWLRRANCAGRAAAGRSYVAHRAAQLMSRSHSSALPPRMSRSCSCAWHTMIHCTLVADEGPASGSLIKNSSDLILGGGRRTTPAHALTFGYADVASHRLGGIMITGSVRRR